MKNKSSRHKDSNTFKFLPFSERISNIDVDVFHKVSHEYILETEENETIFQQTIIKWNVMNLTQGYERFQNEIRAYNYITLPQLLLVKDHLVEILLKHIQEGDPLYLQPLLELLVALARDLQKEFYKYFSESLETLISLLDTKNTEQLEWVFTTLAYLFKFLWRSLVKDIHSVFTVLLPLLSDSKPEYINSFAAESFAFVARKVKDKKTFLNLILKAVRNQPDGVSGCGKLLFQMVTGIDGQFHSCADTVIPFLFESLTYESSTQSLLFEILEHVITNIVNNIKSQKGDLVWSSFVTVLKGLINKYKTNPSDSLINSINLILKLVGQTIEHKEGKFLQKPSLIIDVLVEILNTLNQSEETILLICQIVIVLLLSNNLKLAQEQTSMLTRKLLVTPHKKVFLYFIDNIKTFSLFEASILPSFLKFCVKNGLDSDCFNLLINILTYKAPACVNGMNLSKWTKYHLDFKEANSTVMRILLENLKNDTFHSSLLCLPHLTAKMNDVLTILEESLLNSIKSMNKAENESEKKKLLFFINVTLETMIHLNINHDLLFKIFNEHVLEALLPLTNKTEYISSLQSFDLLISYFKQIGEEKYLTMDMLMKINNVMEMNFSSPFHEVRLLTTHIYTLFEHLPEFKLKHSTDPEAHIEDWQVFTLMYKVESIEPHVHTYRDQLQCLEKLSFDKPQMLMCKQTSFSIIPLRYLCGTLYINFQLLWEPVIKIIASYATGMESNIFWSIFGEELKNAPKSIISPVDFTLVSIEISCTKLKEMFDETLLLKSKPDFVNYRLLLWKALVHFANVAEAKTRDISDLLLDFISTEYVIANSESLPSISIKQNAHVEVDETLEKDDSEIPEKQQNKIMQKNSKLLIKTLIQKLNVFAQFKSPLSMYREPELYKLYFDLLQNRDSEVQKAALDCIFTYKHKYMIPYKENLYNIVDDKNFKNEMTTFRVDKDSNSVLPEHRDGLIPIVMQIVFGKMNVKTGLRTGGKSSSQLRRNVVFRFLAGCQEKELLSFLQKVLRLYNKFLDADNDPTAVVDKVYEYCQLETFLPPKRLLSTINMFGVIQEQCGGLMGNEIISYLLNILFVIGTCLKYAFDHINHVHAGYFSILRNLRSSCIKIVEKFFDHFDQYPWTNQQINAIFTVFIWPYLDKLNIEGIHSPTALLKLITQWGSNPRYFPLLVKFKEGYPEDYILPQVMRLLVNDKSHISVVNVIEEMLEKLLSLQPDEEDIKNSIPVDNVLSIDKEILDKVGVVENLNFGSMILLPHVSVILLKIEKKLLAKSKNLNQKELFILSRISELVWDPDLSDKILNLLLPVVLKRCTKSLPEEIVLKYVTTIFNLIRNVTKPHVHLKEVSPLFFEITYPTCRKILCQILQVMSSKTLSEELRTNMEVIGELNAFDKKWIDQPDFERRHNAFKTAQELLSENKISISLAVLIIYNCCHFINNENDLSARESSAHTLKQVAVYVTRQYVKQVDYILNQTIFNMIRTGLKHPKDNVRNEYISLLGSLARECPDAHFILRDLNKFTNKLDLEVDFFENLIHLQIHRHARALLKFCQITKELTETLNPRTLTQFILPLSTYYLCKEKYSGKNSVIDAAIEAIGVVCRILPWHQYEGVLKYYLLKLSGKLDYQKQLVRLLVTILDAFHFDLHNAHVVEDKQEYNDKNLSKDDAADCSINKETIHDAEEVVGSVVSEDNGIEEQEVDEFVEGEVEQDDEEEDEEVDQAKLKVIEKITVLCKSTATRIVKTLELVLIPKLHKSLAEMTHHESSHKINRKKLGHEREEEDLLRVPISLALVKLLQKLPENILKQNIPGVFMKACSFLKSHLESVRRVARETLQNIMLTLGPKYLDSLLSEMAPLLGRGFQVHVLVYTLHGVLNCLKDHYQPTDLDKILLTVLNLCMTDIFGILSEEKEVNKIAVKVAEARQSKSYDTLQILSRYITESCLLDLILPIKQVLESSHSFKTVHKAQEALRYIAFGLVDNTFITPESLLKFAYGTSSESIPQLIPKKLEKKTEKQLEKMRREKEDCFIISKIAGNRDLYRLQNVKTSIKTNAHVLVEFGLRLCFVMLKRDKVKDESYRMYIDPFINVFHNCLKCKHVKLCTLTLQSLVWVLKYDMPSLRRHIKSITKDIFGILHKYASAGLSKGDNFDLVVAAFKAMAVLVREVTYHTIDTNQLKILLLYVEQDIHNYERQATAFNLLKAILSRKINAPELSDVMEKVAELSITSETDHVRVQSRAVFHQFIMDYPLGDRVEKHLSFYISQLDYELRYGRESAIEMIMTLINSFPLAVLKNHRSTLLITLAARLINDDEPECRRRIAECITLMLKRLPKADRDLLFDIVVSWLKDKNINHRRLGAQICGFFVSLEASTFETRLPLVIPLLMKQFGINNSPGKFVKVEKTNEQLTEEEQRTKDHYLFQMFQLLLKLCAGCPSFLTRKECIENLAVQAQSFLAYPHDWVRLGAAQFIGYVLAQLDVNHLRKLLMEGQSEESGYLCNDPVTAVKSLTLDLCDQLQPMNIKSDLAEQVVKNLVFIAKVLQTIPAVENKPNLLWLAKRMRKIVNTEIVENASSTTLRTEVFKWIAGVATALETENILPILHHLVGPLVREMATTEEKNAPLRQLAKEVSNFLKTKVGVDVYTETLLKQQQNLSVKRAERKRSRTQLAVTDPESFAKKKIKRHEKKKEAKKRKIESLKGTKRNFKRRKTTIDLESSEII
ncbi:small subunit processome component 20 homolog isoform X1 [Diorhabda sublineata]|uniref:small subunit processome component 20 homolog isoform X1 n=1 Tax=Diorhabda sublineata TaxID=1163346 RepID=UPI0024E14A4F|nr:small subunit processome component 20 homolog isoform X1 [Diorhabda sublineata]